MAFKAFESGTKNKRFGDRIFSVKFESAQCVKDLGLITACDHVSRQRCTDAVNKVEIMLGFPKKNLSFMNKDVTRLPLDPTVNTRYRLVLRKC